MTSDFGFETTSDEAATALADQIKGKTILVTGATLGGIGAETARAIAKHQPKLVIVAGRRQEALDDIIQKIKQETPVRVLEGQIQTVRIAPGEEAVGVVALEMASSAQPTVLRFQFPRSKQSEDGLSNGQQMQIAAFLVR